MSSIDGGYKSFLCYVSTKAFFKSKSYDVTKGLLKNEKMLHSWNEKHFKTDGKLFYIIEQHYPKKQELIFLYSMYQWYDKEFFVSDCISDRFQTWDKHRKELLNLNETFDHDFTLIMEHCVETKTKLKDLFCDPSILNLKVSPFTLCTINTVFNLSERINITSVHNLEKKKLTEKLFYLDKLTTLCYSHSRFKNKEYWKEIIRGKLR